MNLNSEFDYHLSAAEQKQIEKLVPLHQAKIHMAFRANLQINGKDYANSGVALSEHMITIATRGFLGKSLKLFDAFHLFNITRVQTINDSTVRIDFNDKVVYVVSTTCMRFTRNLIRNFILANPMLPSQLRFKFICHDSTHFPPFNPPLSPSQLFQFTYNSYCSFFDTTYHHDIPMYYHSLLSSGNAIFDLTKLPLQILENALGDSADINPITSALRYSYFTYGFVCANFTRSEIIESLTPLILSNANLKIVRIVDAGCTKGALSLARAMLESDVSDIVYWDLSKNELEDIGAFTAALGEYEVAVQSIRLDDCNIPALAIAGLWSSLAENEYMHEIQQLSILGSSMNEAACENAVEFFNAISNDENPPLKMLGLGKLASPQAVISSFGIAGVALTRLAIQDTVFPDAAAAELIDYVRDDAALESLDLSGSSLSNDLLIQLIDTISESPSIKTIELNLSKMKMKGDKFVIIMETLCGSLSSKLVGLYLDNCELTNVELSRLSSSLHQLNALKKLSISRNFNYRTDNVGQLLSSLLRNNSIEELTVQGGNGFALKEELIPLICQASSLKKLDISFNGIGDVGLDSVTNKITTSNHLIDISVDGSNVQTFGSIERFLSAVHKSNVIIGAPLPVEDLYSLLSNVPEKDQRKQIERISKLQMKVEKTLLKNRCAAGLHSDLSLLHDPVLDKLIDTVTLGLQKMLNESQLHTHLAITEIVGLPLPFDKDGSSSTASAAPREAIPAAAGSDNESYVSPMMLSSVKEGIDNVVDQLQTLQFNSLLIRRPDAAERLKAKARLALDDDYSEEEETEEESEGVRAFVRPSEFDFSKLTAPVVMEEMGQIDSDSSLTPIETATEPAGHVMEPGREDQGLDSPLI